MDKELIEDCNKALDRISSLLDEVSISLEKRKVLLDERPESLTQAVDRADNLQKTIDKARKHLISVLNWEYGTAPEEIEKAIQILNGKKVDTY